MKTFAHFNAASIDEAVDLLKRYAGKASLIAGGTDLLGKMKDRILPSYPEALINLKTIPGLDGIRIEKDSVKIGSLTKLEDVARHPVVQKEYAALGQAARNTASPHLREMGTLGGNICQDVRCWYYRNPDNRFPCLRKGGGRCYAINGDNRYHSIFGGSVTEGCYAVHPSDTAPALTVLGATIRTSKRTIPIENFFSVDIIQTTVLDRDEIVTDIILPRLPEITKSRFFKFALRKSIDFPIVNCAVSLALKEKQAVSCKICLNSVFVKPYRPTHAEKLLEGKEINEDIAEAVADAAVSNAKPLHHNAYMVPIAKELTKSAILACA
jgi:xanthine dehydrogenase YagS FAD-binding subunit